MVGTIYAVIFKCTATRLVEHELTRNPLGDGFAYVDLAKDIYHLEERFGCILRATRRIQSFTKMLLDRDVEIIEFPSGDLWETIRNFDTFTVSDDKLTNEMARIGGPIKCRTCARARSNHCIAPS